jgi:hypothetical protein
MRVFGLLIAWVLAMAAVHAAAQNNGFHAFSGPQSGMWQSYRVDFSTPTDYLYLSIFINYTECFNGLSDEPYICLDSPWIDDGCDAATTCPAPYLRRVDFDATGVDFAFYVPRTVFFCQNYPPAGRENIHCADFYDGAAVFLDYQYSGADPAIIVTATGGGVVPEPASWALMIAGFGLTGVALRRRQSGRAAVPALACAPLPERDGHSA